MSKKKLLLWGIVAVCLVAVAVGGYFFVANPLEIENTYLRIIPVTNEEQFTEIKDYVRRNLKDEALEVFCDIDEAFPSDSYGDYCKVLIHYTVKNRSLFDASIDDDDCRINMSQKDLLIYRRPTVVSTVLNSFEKKMSDDCFEYFCYRGDLTDEELIEKFKNSTVSFSYKTDLLESLKCKIKLQKSVYLKSFEEFEQIRAELSRNGA